MLSCLRRSEPRAFSASYQVVSEYTVIEEAGQRLQKEGLFRLRGQARRIRIAWGQLTMLDVIAFVV